MKKLIPIVMMVAASQAHAWGDREQGIVTGIAGTLLFQHVMQPRTQPVQAQPPIIIGQPAPPVVIAQPAPPTARVYNLPRQGLYSGRPVYEERMQWEYSCNCYIRVLNQIGWD
jgi:hypothetical protein